MPNMDQLIPSAYGNLTLAIDTHPGGLIGLINTLWHHVDGELRDEAISFLLSGQQTMDFEVFPLTLSGSMLHEGMDDFWCDKCKLKLVCRVIENNSEPIYCVRTGEICMGNWLQTDGAKRVWTHLTMLEEDDGQIDEYRLFGNLCCIQCLEQDFPSVYNHESRPRDENHPLCDRWEYIITLEDAYNDMVEAVVQGKPMTDVGSIVYKAFVPYGIPDPAFIEEVIQLLGYCPATSEDTQMLQPGPVLVKTSAYLYLLWAHEQKFTDTAGHYITGLIHSYKKIAEQTMTEAGYDKDIIANTRSNLTMWNILEALNNEPDLLFRVGYPTIAPSAGDFRGRWMEYRSWLKELDNDPIYRKCCHGLSEHQILASTTSLS